jgi:hypothetical protein
MSTELTAPRSRRALLAAAAGAAAATVVAALDRPAAVLAGVDGDVVLGASNTSLGTTAIVGGSPGIVVLEARGAAARDADSIAIHAMIHHSADEAERAGIAILGEANAAGIGVEGTALRGVAVMGTSATTGTGVHGDSYDGTGVDAYSAYGTAVAADGTRGTAIHASSWKGSALKVHGKVRLNRSGRATVRAGRRSVTVDLAGRGGLAGTPLCFANLLAHREGIWVVAVQPNTPSSGKLRIYLNRTVTSPITVAWLVLDALRAPAPWEL